jgi:hypothetical protein
MGGLEGAQQEDVRQHQQDAGPIVVPDVANMNYNTSGFGLLEGSLARVPLGLN